MSSTNRSDARESHVADYYVTPVTSICDFLNTISEDFPEVSFSKMKILDPCAGGDANHPMSYPTALSKCFNLENPVSTWDIREDSLADDKCNFLETQVEPVYDMIITNPPFNIALDIIKKSLYSVKDGGIVIMLLRLNFFGSKERSKWFKDNMPSYCYVHSKRMRFTRS